MIFRSRSPAQVFHKLLKMQDSNLTHYDDWQGLELLNRQVAGLDLSSTFHCCYLPPYLLGSSEANYGDGGRVDNFDCDQTGLDLLADHLVAHGVEEVVMEATGVYWFGVYRVLLKRGLKCCVVNPTHAHHIAGRKTDEHDARWLCRLHAYGLLKASFVAPEECWELRDLMRQRDQLIKDRSRYVNLMIKQLDIMNVKLHKVISDATGVTGLSVVRHIAQGVPDPKTDWTIFHSSLLRCSKEDFKLALSANYTKHGCFLLAQSLSSYDHICQQIKDLDIYVERILLTRTQGVNMAAIDKHLPQNEADDFIRPLRGKSGKRLKKAKSKNAPLYDQKQYLHELLGVDLTTIPGIEANTVLNLVAEIGTDLKAKFPTSAHFVSWLQLAPNNKISANKVIGKKRVTSVNRAHVLFRDCAYSLANSKGYFGKFYRSIKLRKNGRTANKALAKKVATIYYQMITTKQAFDEQRYKKRPDKKARELKRLEKMARKQGFELVPKESVAA